MLPNAFFQETNFEAIPVGAVHINEFLFFFVPVFIPQSCNRSVGCHGYLHEITARRNRIFNATSFNVLLSSKLSKLAFKISVGTGHCSQPHFKLIDLFLQPFGVFFLPFAKCSLASRHSEISSTFQSWRFLTLLDFARVASAVSGQVLA
jgi:hypothetical protein